MTSPKPSVAMATYKVRLAKKAYYKSKANVRSGWTSAYGGTHTRAVKRLQAAQKACGAAWARQFAAEDRAEMGASKIAKKILEKPLTPRAIFYKIQEVEELLDRKKGKRK